MKIITKKMARFAPLEDFYVQQVIEDANSRDELLAFQFSPQCHPIRKEYRASISKVIYSIAKDMKVNDTRVVFARLASIFGTCEQYIERWMRGMAIDNNKIYLVLQFGEHYIEVK